MQVAYCGCSRGILDIFFVTQILRYGRKIPIAKIISLFQNRQPKKERSLDTISCWLRGTPLDGQKIISHKLWSNPAVNEIPLIAPSETLVANFLPNNGQINFHMTSRIYSPSIFVAYAKISSRISSQYLVRYPANPASHGCGKFFRS